MAIFFWIVAALAIANALRLARNQSKAGVEAARQARNARAIAAGRNRTAQPDYSARRGGRDAAARAWGKQS